MIIEANGISLYVEDHGDGVPVVLLHGFPDSSRLWRRQVPFLAEHGFRAIVPDLRGYGRSDRPDDVAAYRLRTVVGDVTGILDALGVARAHVVGHDWGAAVAWLTATLCPDRVSKLVVLSVPHPLVPATLRQLEMAWYMLFFQFAGVAADVQPRGRRHRAVDRRPVSPGSADRGAELVPGQRRPAAARPAPRLAGRDGADDGHLVRW
jgi:pimeloyl-ACP methyl ester carboxylesterase